MQFCHSFFEFLMSMKHALLQSTLNNLFFLSFFTNLRRHGLNTSSILKTSSRIPQKVASIVVELNDITRNSYRPAHLSSLAIDDCPISDWVLKIHLPHVWNSRRNSSITRIRYLSRAIILSSASWSTLKIHNPFLDRYNKTEKTPIWYLDKFPLRACYK